MKLVINIEQNDQILSVDIGADLNLGDFKALLQAETEIDPEKQKLILNGLELKDDDKQLKELGLQEDDLLILRKKVSAPSVQPPVSVAPDGQIEAIRTQLLNNNRMSQQLSTTNPELHRNLNNPAEFKRLFLSTMDQLAGQNQQQGVTNDELARLQQNPDDIDSQKKIMELIQKQQIEENMQLAYETLPESFVSVSMLYVNVEVNGHQCKAFVDTGAQSTIISPHLAEKTGLLRLLDKRFQGEARGVGSAAILGKIHSAPMKIGTDFFPCSFICLDTQVDLLLGLDMLRRHRATIDLFKNKLIIGNTETSFLSEAEIPSSVFNDKGTSSLGFGGNIFSGAGQSLSSGASTSTSKAPPSQAAGSAALNRNGGHSEAKIKQLMDIGVSKAEAIRALDQCDGNVDVAASLLFQ